MCDAFNDFVGIQYTHMYALFINNWWQSLLCHRVRKMNMQIVKKCRLMITNPWSTTDIDPILLQCWPSVCDAGPTLKQYWVNENLYPLEIVSSIEWLKNSYKPIKFESKYVAMLNTAIDAISLVRVFTGTSPKIMMSQNLKVKLCSYWLKWDCPLWKCNLF